MSSAKGAKVAEFDAPAEVEQLERGEPPQFWREPSQFRKSTETNAPRSFSFGGQ